jgi:hypothetical protein
MLSVTGVNGYDGTITFSAASCTGLPAGSSCSFSPASVTGSGTTTLTISTTAAAMLAPVGHQSTPAARAAAGRLMLSLIGFAILWLAIQARRRKLRWSVVAGFLIVACLIGVASCGGSSSNSSGGGGGAVPANIVVTGSDGTNSHSVSFTLTID